MEAMKHPIAPPGFILSARVALLPPWGLSGFP